MSRALALLAALLLAGCATAAPADSPAHRQGFYGATSGGMVF